LYPKHWSFVRHKFPPGLRLPALEQLLDDLSDFSDCVFLLEDWQAEHSCKLLIDVKIAFSLILYLAFEDLDFHTIHSL
jgi:hypothetical protein